MTKIQMRRGTGFLLFIAGAIIFGVTGLKWIDASGWTGVEAPEIAATASILLDAETGEVLYEHNAGEALPPASMSKMMTELIVLDFVNDGKLKWSDVVDTSGYAAEAPGAQIGFGAGERWSVRELFEATAVHSSNDAVIALAEHIAGSEAEFVKLMNKRAKEIGLSKHAVFGNATGLSRTDLAAFPQASSERDTVLTAKDTAVLARFLIKKYPEVLDVTAKGSVKLARLDSNLPSTNQMLNGKPFAFPGSDGLKTGYTERAGYCFTGTVVQNGRRLISVVMGAETAESRFMETSKLMQYGFYNSKWDAWKADLASKIGF
ncbi:D-alanyl-D-alanine carboxypeptidase family protein [Paenibacillus sp. NPDC058071]|uniref:D-alanyl-D-alanine carboxypeptidase family protein n=1 Tax=Paenibacillus sp. NPDC058071 TaxID=3346326 RepID=UPI0036DD9365